jgi:histidine ammonia-lyase
MRSITRNSEIVSSHRDCSRIQDAYTLRCSPQVHGASRDAIAATPGGHRVRDEFLHQQPPHLCRGRGVSPRRELSRPARGPCHGLSLAWPWRSLQTSPSGGSSGSSIPMLSGLPAFLVRDGGLNSGFMIAQYTAAALVSENKVLSHPACVDSIPTSANKEDHVSMGTIAARKCREIVENAEACRGHRAPLRGAGPGPLHQHEARRGRPSAGPSPTSRPTASWQPTSRR